jgi:hypothetical protein
MPRVCVCDCVSVCVCVPIFFKPGSSSELLVTEPGSQGPLKGPKTLRGLSLTVSLLHGLLLSFGTLYVICPCLEGGAFFLELGSVAQPLCSSKRPSYRIAHICVNSSEARRSILLHNFEPHPLPLTIIPQHHNRLPVLFFSQQPTRHRHDLLAPSPNQRVQRRRRRRRRSLCLAAAEGALCIASSLPAAGWRLFGCSKIALDTFIVQILCTQHVFQLWWRG